MKLTKIVTTLALVTIMSLVYIQLQVQIYDLSYQTKSKESKIYQLADNNRYVTRNICQFKSASHLGVKMLSDSSKMQFADKDHVIDAGVPYAMAMTRGQAAVLPKKQEGLISRIFSLKSVAEARTLR